MTVIAPHVRVTPVIEVPGDELGVDATLVFKLEFLQVTGSFKDRGATNFIATQPIADSGVVAASGGNHGAAVARAAQRFGHKAHIFLPRTSEPAKTKRISDYGAVVHHVGDVVADAYTSSLEFIEGSQGTSIHPFDDPVVMAGAGTCAMEFERQAGHLDAILIACGGGGLSGGTAAWLGSRSEVVVCETDGTASYAAAVANRGPVDIEVHGIAADALGARKLGEIPWAALNGVEATSVVTFDQALLAAQNRLWSLLRVFVEPSGAAPMAALMDGQWRPRAAGARVGLILSGANTSLNESRESG